MLWKLTDAKISDRVNDISQVNLEAELHGETTVGENKEGEDEEEEEGQKTRQSTVNLIGVDAKRISDFLSFNNYFAGSLFKLLVSFTFLLNLIGWKSLLAGLVTMVVQLPINIFFTKRYSRAQDALMKVRDTKLGVVTEALQGIRQIKFSALERQWQAKLGKVRDRELKELWRVFVSDTFLLACWIASPIMLTATSLAVYSILHGDLTPSIAFTALGVFNELEITLSVIPELSTDLIDAWVSSERIEKYLAAPERIPNTTDSPSISLENVSVAWPSDEEKRDDDDRYVLRDLNLSFPEKELSVISGKTGTGKSLLLAAILGEVDVLKGRINVPRPPPLTERFDHMATKDNWILPSSIAFVAQIPWIENASIKDNILFGLPLDENRYKKVIEVCALRKDLEMLTDGENTEIGANGINLSGGQRWRMTFARALYSRAGILVLDDIFSAVDAHVGRFIFEKGLTGELGLGRTRILVTHHVALCKPRTKYLVELGGGTIEHAGLVENLEKDGTLEQIINQVESAREIKDDEATNDAKATAVNSEESSLSGAAGDVLKKVDSKTAVKKFVEDETREEGGVKKAIYIDYLKACGGVPFWGIALVVFILQQCLTLGMSIFLIPTRIVVSRQKRSIQTTLIEVSLTAIFIGRSWWLRLWTGSYEEEATKTFYNYVLQFVSARGESSSASDNLKFYLGIYVCISLISSIIATLRFFYIFTGSIRASKQLFEKLSFTVLRTPLRWMDTVPLGRILNRFTGDFNVVDSRMAGDMAHTAVYVFQLIGIIVAG